MRKVIAAINMTLDGYCDHTAVLADEELHQYYSALLDNAGIILYGRKTYQLMQFWQSLIENPSGKKSMDDFAIAIDNVPKIVYSRTLERTDWNSALLSTLPLEEEIQTLKQQQGKDIYAGSRSMIIQLMNLNLLDELQLCVHPVVAGEGLPLFENIDDRSSLKLLKTKTLNSGAVVLYYETVKEKIMTQ